MTRQLERPNSWNNRIAGMIGQLEQPNSWKKMTGQLERPKAEMTGKPERPESWNYQKSLNDQIEPCDNLLAEGMFISWIGNVDLIIKIWRIFLGSFCTYS